MVRAGVESGLLDEMIWWRTDHLRFWALEALVIYVRAAAECRAETAPHLWADRGPPRRPARRGDLTSTARTLGCGRTECRRRLGEPRPEPAICTVVASRLAFAGLRRRPR
jgi:hypothetical protein